MTTTQPKLIRARRPYRCGACGATIEPGELYRRRTVSQGRVGPKTVELRDGYPTVVAHGFRAQSRVCQKCL